MSKKNTVQQAQRQALVACLERRTHRVHDVVAWGPDELMRDLIEEPAHKAERRRQVAWAGTEPAVLRHTSLEAL